MLSYKKILDLRNMMLIKKSGLFDYKYYINEYPEAGKKALEHYYYEGYKIGNNPSKEFDNDFYLSKNPDVLAIGINPLLHYVLSGKNEGRRIKKALGITIPKLYKIITKNEYSYSVSLKNVNKKRVTIFLSKDNKNNSFIIDVIKKLYNNDYIFRLVYEDLIVDDLCKLFIKNNIDIGKLEFTSWNKNYLLEVYTNEVFICNDYNVLISLVNSNYIKKPIYYYIDDNINYSEKEIKYLSLLVDNNYVKCIGNNINLTKYKLNIINNYSLNKDSINTCIVFDDFSIQMFDILQSYILNNRINAFIKLFYFSNNFHKTICLPNETLVKYISNYNNMDLIIKICYDEQSKSNIDSNNIIISFVKTDKKISICKIEDLSFDKQEILSLKNIDLNLFKEGDNNV